MGLLQLGAHFTTHRLGESALSNADTFSFDVGGRVVMVDGASVSYDPQRWASIIATNIDVGAPLPQLPPLAAHFTDLIPDGLPWNLEALAERGAHATYLAARSRRFMRVDTLEADALGDCLLVLHTPGATPVTRSWPFAHASEFPRAPSVVSSVDPFIRGRRPPTFRCNFVQGMRLFLMTDAMGRYTRRHLDDGAKLEELPFTQPGFVLDDFVRWSVAEREVGSLEDDDLTVVEVVVP